LFHFFFSEVYRKLLKELQSNKIFNTKFQVYKSDYFLELLQKELNQTKEFNYKSFLMLIRLNKKTVKSLKTAINYHKANTFFSKLLLNKFRKDDVIGYLNNGVFGVILTNLNETELKKVVIKFTSLLNHSSMYINDDYIEVKAVISITKINDKNSLEKGLELLDQAYEEEKEYIIE